MDEARAVLARLERIERLEEAGAPGRDLLQEVRSLLHEAEVWVRVEPGPTDRAEDALAACRKPFWTAPPRIGGGAGLW